MRLLFASIHCYLDPSSGAALCTREMLELLAVRGMDCRVLTVGVLDPERETSLNELLATLELPARRFQAQLGTGKAAGVIDLGVNGARVTLMPTASRRAELPVRRAIRSGGSDFGVGSQSQCTPAFSVSATRFFLVMTSPLRDNLEDELMIGRTERCRPRTLLSQ